MLNFIKENAFILLTIVGVVDVCIAFLLAPWWAKKKKVPLIGATVMLFKVQGWVLLLLELCSLRYLLHGIGGLIYMTTHRTLSETNILILASIICFFCFMSANTIKNNGYMKETHDNSSVCKL